MWARLMFIAAIWLGLALGSLSGQGPLRRGGVVTESVQGLFPAGPGQKPFDVTRHNIALSEVRGSVPRDAIPGLTNPSFLLPEQATRLLEETDRVLGVFFRGEAKAYPICILTWHELVNDEVGGQPILVTW